jgi:hypothetical protein
VSLSKKEKQFCLFVILRGLGTRILGFEISLIVQTLSGRDFPRLLVRWNEVDDRHKAQDVVKARVDSKQPKYGDCCTVAVAGSFLLGLFVPCENKPE